MSHRDDLNELTSKAATSDNWEEAVSELHSAFQIVGVVLDELEARVKSLEAAAGTASGS